jgi:hypothetical protein
MLWNVWKERNRRIFAGRRLAYLEVVDIARNTFFSGIELSTASGQLSRLNRTSFLLFFHGGFLAYYHLNINMPSPILLGFPLLLNKKAALMTVAPKMISLI